MRAWLKKKHWRKRRENAYRSPNCTVEGQRERTEDELLGRCEHVERECDFILVAFALQPSDQFRGIKHRGGGFLRVETYTLYVDEQI